MLLVLEYIWMCLSDEFIISSSCLDKFIVKSEFESVLGLHKLAARQLLDKFVIYYALILDLFPAPEVQF